MNHHMTEATARPIFKMKTNYNLHEKLETKSLRLLKVNTHTIISKLNVARLKPLVSSFPCNLGFLINHAAHIQDKMSHYQTQFISSAFLEEIIHVTGQKVPDKFV